MARIYQIIQQDRDRASQRAEEAVEEYDEKRDRKGIRLGRGQYQRDFEFKSLYIGFLAEECIGRVTGAYFSERYYEGMKSNWDLEIPEIGRVEIKSTEKHEQLDWEVEIYSPLNFQNYHSETSFRFLWLCYVRQNDIQEVARLSADEVSKYPHIERRTYWIITVRIDRALWQQVEK